MLPTLHNNTYVALVYYYVYLTGLAILNAGFVTQSERVLLGSLDVYIDVFTCIFMQIHRSSPKHCH